MDFIIGSADEQVQALVHREYLRRFNERPETKIGDCPRCGVIETLMLGALCHHCEQEASWSRDNRAVCELIHGGHR